MAWGAFLAGAGWQNGRARNEVAGGKRFRTPHINASQPDDPHPPLSPVRLANVPKPPGRCVSPGVFLFATTSCAISSTSPVQLFPIARSRFTSWRFTIICRTGCAAVPKCCSTTLFKRLKSAIVRIGVIIDTPRPSLREVRVRNQHHHHRAKNSRCRSHFRSPSRPSRKSSLTRRAVISEPLSDSIFSGQFPGDSQGTQLDGHGPGKC
jgi:hypothetical protein